MSAGERAKISAAYLSDLERGMRAWRAPGAHRVIRELEKTP